MANSLLIRDVDTLKHIVLSMLDHLLISRPSFTPVRNREWINSITNMPRCDRTNVSFCAKRLLLIIRRIIAAVKFNFIIKIMELEEVLRNPRLLEALQSQMKRTTLSRLRTALNGRMEALRVQAIDAAERIEEAEADLTHIDRLPEDNTRTHSVVNGAIEISGDGPVEETMETLSQVSVTDVEEAHEATEIIEPEPVYPRYAPERTSGSVSFSSATRKRRNPDSLSTVKLRSILNRPKTDNLGLPRSLYSAGVHARSKKFAEFAPEWERVKRNRQDFVKLKAEELTLKAGITIPERGCGHPEISQFQRYLAAENCCIKVYRKGSLGNGEPALFDGTDMVVSLGYSANFVLNIQYDCHIEHYETILSIKGASCGTRYCSACNIGYARVTQHRCSNICPRCLTKPSCRTDVERIDCKTCRRVFHGPCCYDHHLSKTSFNSNRSVCETLRICNNCNVYMDLTKGTHVCGKAYRKAPRTH